MSTRIIRTQTLRPQDGMHVRHPLNPNKSDIYLHALSQQGGLKRQVVNLAHLPPGCESFLPHAQVSQEEFVFILSGQGIAVFDEEEEAVGPGDFIAYPCDGVAHQLRNSGDEDLVYLMGGERTPLEVAIFPTVGKIGVFGEDGVTLYDESSASKLSFADYLAKE